MINRYNTEDAGRTPVGIPPERFDTRGAIREMADGCGWSEAIVLDLILDLLADEAAIAPGLTARLSANLRAIHDDEMSGEIDDDREKSREQTIPRKVAEN